MADTPFHAKRYDLMLFKKEQPRDLSPERSAMISFLFLFWRFLTSFFIDCGISRAGTRAVPTTPGTPEPERDGNRPQGVVMGNGGGVISWRTGGCPWTSRPRDRISHFSTDFRYRFPVPQCLTAIYTIVLLTPYAAEIFRYKPWRPKGCFQFKIIINVL